MFPDKRGPITRNVALDGPSRGGFGSLGEHLPAEFLGAFGIALDAVDAGIVDQDVER